jgi:peptidoglycan/xylan/chitin deacetylase (PgdA/CDA1 family)
MDWLSRHARVVSLLELINQPGDADLNVAITFDDGYESLVQKVQPVFKRYGFAATVYLNTGWIDNDDHMPSEPALGHYPGEKFLSWTDVDKLSSAGWSIGSHGVNHDDLTRVNSIDVDRELMDSKVDIEKHLGVECRNFSYTWGKYSRTLKERVRGAGYQNAVSGIHGAVRYKSDLFMIPRVNVSADYMLEDFRAIVRGGWDYLGWLQRARRLIT